MQARQGKNALNEEPKSRPRVQDIESQNEDLQAVGEAIPYLIAVLYFGAAAAWLPLAKVAALTFDLLILSENVCRR